MPDLLRIKSNVAKMVQQDAPEEDIDAYIQAEGTTVNAIKNIKITQQKPSYFETAIKPFYTQLPKDVYREVISPLVAGSSSLAFGIPRAVARQTGTEQLIYPEQQTLLGKGLRIGSEAVGLLGGGAAKGAGLAIKGAERFIPKLVGKGLTRGIIRGGLSAGTFGLLQQPPEDKTRLQQAGEFAAYGAAIPIAGAGLNKVGQILAKSGRWMAKNIGGVTDATVATIKRLGANRVFDPLKAKADYISQNVAPRVYQKLTNFVKLADDAYDKAIANAPEGKKFNIRPSIEEAGNRLKRLGLITEKGNLTELGNSEIARDSVYGKMLDFYKSANAISGVEKLQGKDLTQSQIIKAFRAIRETLVNKDQFLFLRDKLNALYKNKPSDIDVAKVVNKFYESGEASGIKGLQQARILQRKVFEIENKIDLNKIIRDLVKAKNPQWSKIIQKEYGELVDKGVINKQDYQNIFDDLMAHFANIDFELVSETPGTGGGFYPSRAGFFRKGIAGGTKQYYKNIQPRTQPVTSKLQQVLEKIISMQR